MDNSSHCVISGTVKISDGNRPNSSNDVRKRMDEGDYFVDEDYDEEEDDLSEDELLAQMGYAKSEPEINIIKDSNEEEEEGEDGLSEEAILAQMGYLKNEPPKHEPITTPMANLNLVSAFKGSREKEGNPAKESRVSWAPDVYDPPPTSEDHFTTNKTERHKSEHKVKGVAGKNRQKTGGKKVGASDNGVDVGKASRGGGSKASVGGKAAGKSKDKKPADKKQAKKHGRGASKYSGFDED